MHSFSSDFLGVDVLQPLAEYGRAGVSYVLVLLIEDAVDVLCEPGYACGVEEGEEETTELDVTERTTRQPLLIRRQLRAAEQIGVGGSQLSERERQRVTLSAAARCVCG